MLGEEFDLIFSVMQLVASAECAGALDVIDDLQHLLVYIHLFMRS